MKEYCIYIRQGSGRPYILDTYKNIDIAKVKLYDIISLEVERQRPYFVDNNFFENKYSLVGDVKYLKILEREISAWTDYSETSSKLDKNNNDKIIYFMNF